MSKKFIWTPEYSVNVEEIDGQHKEFLKICNSLLDLEENPSFTDEEALIKAGQLGSYASYHLSTEEEDFEITKYPDALAHISIHNKFREKAKEFEDKIRDKNNDKKAVAKEMAEFAGDWLMQHIMIMDKKYSKFFNEHGIK